jgi:hypothetical protein
MHAPHATTNYLSEIPQLFLLYAMRDARRAHSRFALAAGSAAMFH